MSLKLLKTDGDLAHRFSFVISKKVAKTAVGRNKLRRRGYSTLATLLPSFKKKCAGIFFLKKGVAELSLSGFEYEMKELFHKAVNN